MLRNIWDYLTDKRQLSVRDRNSDEVHWKLNVSPIGLWGGVITLLIVIFITLLLLMAYTPILEILPNYRTKVAAMHDTLTSEIMRAQQMEQKFKDIEEYNDAITTILNGSTPASHSTTLVDATRYDKTTILTNEADSLLRAKMESPTSEYSLANNTKRPKFEAPRFLMPINGVVSRGYNDPLSNKDITLTPIGSDMTVMAVEQGTVVGISNQADGTAVIAIHHSGGYLSVYRNLSERLVRRGQVVNGGAAIGRVGSIEGEESIEHSAELQFELWRDGIVQNPEEYISISK
jgi:murein DD-endopeptidase MepM/ murein hydrolase activator NlpD